MNKSNFLFCCFLFVASGLMADQISQDDTLKTSLELAQGYRHDRLDVKFHRDSGKRDSYRKKIEFKDVDIYSSRLSLMLSKNDFFFKGIAGYGDVRDGRFHRSSHFQEGRFHEESTQRSHISGDYTADFALTFGKNFRLANEWSLAPSLGYGVYIQKFHTNRGKFHEKNNHPVLKRHVRGHGVKEHIKATWYSPQVGLNVQKAFTQSLNGFINYNFLFPLSYHADAHFINRDHDKISYNQENKGYKSFGHIGTVGLEWKFADRWSLTPEFELMKFYSRGGDAGHRYHFTKATREAFEGRLTLGYAF